MPRPCRLPIVLPLGLLGGFLGDALLLGSSPLRGGFLRSILLRLGLLGGTLLCACLGRRGLPGLRRAPRPLCWIGRRSRLVQ